MVTMIDLLQDARAAGLPIEVTPDFKTNGHKGILIQSPRCGYLHHTASTRLQSVYYHPTAPGWPHTEARPEVPSPRCQVYAARARTQGCRQGCPFKDQAHLVFVSAGLAYQAGAANGSRIAAAMRGQINAKTPNAAQAGLVDTMNANDEAMGIEIDWGEGEGWPPDLLEVVCQLMAVAVRTFDWPGVGAWIRHRQATNRKPDPQTDYDFWTRADQILRGEDDSMATWSDTDSTNLKRVADGVDRTFREGFRSLDTSGQPAPTAENYSIRGINNAQDITNAKLDLVLAALAELPDAIATALEPAPPPEA